MLTLPVTNIQRFSTKDGPGIRTVVFLKGCAMRCQWCHNPESLSPLPQVFYISQNCIRCGNCETGCPAGAREPVGKQMTIDEIIDEVMKDKDFYGEHGGVTLSGGEPLFHGEGCLALLRRAKENNLHTVIETAGYFDNIDINELAELTDIFLWDWKNGDPKRHKQYTGVNRELIDDNLKKLDQHAKKIILRSLQIKGVNMDDKNYKPLAETVKILTNCIGVELLPYHPYGSEKYKQLGMPCDTHSEWIPNANDMLAARQTLQNMGCKIIK